MKKILFLMTLLVVGVSLLLPRLTLISSLTKQHTTLENSQKTVR